MKWVDSEIQVPGEVPTIPVAEILAEAPRKSDEELAREYAELIDNIYLNAEDMDLDSCPPDRRFVKGDKEAWIYEHDNICELVFVK